MIEYAEIFGSTMDNKTTLILASNSPRRRWLLSLAGYDFLVKPADVDESVLPGESPDDYVARLAEIKAREVGRQVTPGCVVIAADTTVADGNKILGKPVDSEEAENMLRQLRGRVHQVFTAVAVYESTTDTVDVNVCRTDVPMRGYSDLEIQRYIESGDPFDKAGGYAIQHEGFHPVEELNGCFSNVVGLPLCCLQETLADFGIHTKVNYAEVCKEAFDYNCPVYPDRLRCCE